MVMHSPHAEGGWGVCANRVSRLAALWNTKARFVAWLGHLPKEAQAIFGGNATGGEMLRFTKSDHAMHSTASSRNSSRVNGC